MYLAKTEWTPLLKILDQPLWSIKVRSSKLDYLFGQGVCHSLHKNNNLITLNWCYDNSQNMYTHNLLGAAPQSMWVGTLNKHSSLLGLTCYLRWDLCGRRLPNLLQTSKTLRKLAVALYIALHCISVGNRQEQLKVVKATNIHHYTEIKS